MDYILGISGEDLGAAFNNGCRFIFVDVSQTDNRGPELASLSINIPLDRIGEMSDQPAESEIIVFSSTPGDGSVIAASIELFDLGFQNVRFFKGDLNQLTWLLKKHENDLKPLLINAA